MGVKTVCPHCGRSITIWDGYAYKTNKGRCPKCKKLVKKTYQLKCPECYKAIKVQWGPIRRREATCPKCGVKINKADIPEFKEASASSQPAAPAPAQVQTKVVVASGIYKQSGVLCLNCKSVTPLGNKKCQGCKSKLKVKPSTVVYYNGTTEAIQCQKCSGYTSFQVVKCQKCGKKLKF